MYYKLLDVNKPQKISADMKAAGKAKFSALYFIIHCFGANNRIIQLDTILATHTLNLRMRKHDDRINPLVNDFNTEDVRWVWDYMLKHNLIEEVKGN